MGSSEFKRLGTEENHKSRHSVYAVLGFFLNRNGPIGVSVHASKHYGKYQLADNFRLIYQCIFI